MIKPLLKSVSTLFQKEVNSGKISDFWCMNWMELPCIFLQRNLKVGLLLLFSELPIVSFPRSEFALSMSTAALNGFALFGISCVSIPPLFMIWSWKLAVVFTISAFVFLLGFHSSNRNNLYYCYLSKKLFINGRQI